MSNDLSTEAKKSNLDLWMEVFVQYWRDYLVKNGCPKWRKLTFSDDTIALFRQLFEDKEYYRESEAVSHCAKHFGLEVGNDGWYDYVTINTFLGIA